MMSRAPLLFYCQHSLGIGHLTRSFALCRALLDGFDVVLLNGSPLPPGVPVPPGVEIVDLPPISARNAPGLSASDPRESLAQVRARRRRLVLETFDRCDPRLVLLELFPFGRKKFAFELIPLIKAARRAPGGPRPVVSSLRDILVAGRQDQQRHDDRAAWLANRYFDAVLVHADPRLVRLEDTFLPRRPLRTPVHYTGFVTARRPPARVTAATGTLLVSAGGGAVGKPLFEAALAAHALLDPATRPPLRIVAGPFLPEDEYVRLSATAAGLADVEVVRAVPDLEAEMRSCAVSVSQCGYNTAMDVLAAGVAALVVPYAAPGEDEQLNRARRLAALGALRWLDPAGLEPVTLAREIQRTMKFVPAPNRLDLDGATRSAALLRDLCRTGTAARAAGPDWTERLARTLARAVAPVEFWFRDDDGGWEDAALVRLLDLFAMRGVPVDVAVIPMALGPGLARTLRRLQTGPTAPGFRLGVHQHGLAHVSHAPDGRKCEFGPSRARAAQERDIRAGWARLAELVPGADRFFTPPWNRCSQATVEALRRLGFEALSRDRTAAPLDVAGLAEVPVAVDWMRHRRDGGPDHEALGAALEAAASGGGPVGVMLHHAVMTEADFACLDRLLHALRGARMACCVSLRTLVGRTAAARQPGAQRRVVVEGAK